MIVILVGSQIEKKANRRNKLNKNVNGREGDQKGSARTASTMTPLSGFTKTKILTNVRTRTGRRPKIVKSLKIKKSSDYKAMMTMLSTVIKESSKHGKKRKCHKDDLSDDSNSD